MTGDAPVVNVMLAMIFGCVALGLFSRRLTAAGYSLIAAGAAAMAFAYLFFSWLR